jgi:hypothetical protein
MPAYFGAIRKPSRSMAWEIACRTRMSDTSGDSRLKVT